MKWMNTAWPLAIALAAVGCAGDTGANGTNGANGADGAAGANGLSTLVDVVDEPTGENCSNGGLAVRVGVDANRN
ncbi:MAG: alkaline phosphatase, partial [Myxococcota bacterium]